MCSGMLCVCVWAFSVHGADVCSVAILYKHIYHFGVEKFLLSFDLKPPVHSIPLSFVFGVVAHGDFPNKMTIP